MKLDTKFWIQVEKDYLKSNRNYLCDSSNLFKYTWEHTPTWKVIKQLELVFITEVLDLPDYYFDPEGKTLFRNTLVESREVRQAFLRWVIHTKMKVVITLE
jgi:hypothetical protein